MERFVRSLLPALLWLLALPAIAGDPETAPIPRLETGGHTARINRIAVDRAGRWLVTVSHDKSARVWDLQSGHLVQVLRQPIGYDAQEGKLLAVAISPDGNTIAVGGYTTANTNGYWIYLFDRAKGTLSGALGGLTDAATGLTWSPDGRHLAAMLRSDGLRIFDLLNPQPVYVDQDYRDQSYSADFATDGRLITTSFDGYLRMYKPIGGDYMRDEPVVAPNGHQPYSARFSPDGQRIALGYADTPHVDVLDAKTLEVLPGYAVKAGVGQGNFGNVAWSRDGRMLYAGGSQADGRLLRQILRWPNGGRGPGTAVGVSTNTILDLIALPDGGLAFSTADPAWGVLGRNGRVRRHTDGPIVDFRDHDLDLRIDATGTSVEFTYSTTTAEFSREEHTACFEFVTKALTTDACPGYALRAPNIGGQLRTDWQDSNTPHFIGKTLKLQPYERSWSLAIGQRGFVLGTEWQIYAYDRDGSERWRQPLPSVAWAINVSGDGRYVVVAAGDGTLRWYADRGDRAEEVLALYVHPDGKRWIAWTPQGFFDASGPDAEQLFGFQINHGREQAGEFVKASQLRERFLNPELIAHRLDADGDQRLQATLAKLGNIDAALRDPPPTLRLGGAPQIDDVNGSVRIPLHIEGRTGGTAGLRYSVDDGADLQPRDADGKSGDSIFVNLGLSPGTHTVTITQASPLGTRSPEVKVKVTMPGAPLLPALHVLAIGISNYRDVDLRPGVRYASSDAAMIASKFAARGRPLFRDVYSRTLRDGDADRNSIEAGLKELAGSVQPQDVLVVFLAGHGTADEVDYYFVPQEAVQSSRADLLNASLSGQRLRELLAAIPASKKLVLLDTCASGKFQQPDRSIDTKNAAEALARKSGFALIAAAGGDRYALEATSHGVFTSALLEALDGKATVGDDGTLSIDSIADYVSRRVPELTNLHFKVEQFPVRQFNGNSFPVAVVRGAR